ncbi:diguanylate cyclase (GGDEF)-like protein [Alteromonadaceae bacterium 2753L.S.0a.02]|nr:diguanylate cyclase (GGDEF)-like protein [Alteromonadaceae bacterium 2753L.S.0a.02]
MGRRWRNHTLAIFCLLACINNCIASITAAPDASLNLSEHERAWLRAHSDISLAFDGYFPPYSFVNDDGELEGIAVEVFKRLAASTGIEFSVSPLYTWKDLYPEAQRKQIDVVATMVNREERQQWFNFTDPYISKSLVIVTRGENQTIRRRDDLKNKKVALVESYQYVARILKDYPSVQPLYVNTMLDALNAVSTGKADAAITFLGGGHFLRTKYLLTNLKYAAVYDKKNSRESVGVRNDWPELVGILNKALDAIPEHEMLAIQEAWLPKDYRDLLVEIDLSDTELAWLEKHRDIRLGIDPEFAPFEYLEGGKYSGMASDYIALLNQRLNLNMQVVPNLTWDAVIKRAERGEIDVLPAVGKTMQRQQYLAYTEPYLQFHRVIITRSDMPFILSLDDVAELRVGVQVNSSHHGYLKENSSIKPITFATLEESLMALSGGKIDAFVGNVASSTFWIRKLNLTNLKVAAPVSQEVQNLHFAVRKDWPELVSILQKGLDSISPAQRNKISDKWIYVKYEPTLNYRLLLQIVAVFSLLLAGIVLWNVVLNRKVHKHAQQLLHYAHYDALTGLPNRFLIQDRLSQIIQEAQRANTRLAMISIDIDDFKKINETFGHETGDKALVAVANHLQEKIAVNIELGRLGGDQFLAIVSELKESTDAAIIVQNLLQSFEAPLRIDDAAINIRVSIGIAIYPEDGADAEQLIKSADTATHHSKTQGQGSYAFFMEKLQKRAARTLKLEENMRLGLKRSEFFVVYQPKVATESREIIGFEALLRWRNPELGDVAPDEFIPVAEKNGLIEPLGFFVLQTALATLADINSVSHKPLSMAVNFSPRQFRSRNLIHQILTAVESAGVAPHCLELEITEGVLISGYGNVEDILRSLKRGGVTLAMDDFGTGYSSLSYLRRYTFDVLKIDREFIAELASKKADRQLVAATIAMAHNLGLQVVAEGVETEAQFLILKELACDLIQGWYVGRPTSIDNLAMTLQNKWENENYQYSP